MQRIIELLRKVSLKDIILVMALIVFDLGIHPLTYGPDRYIHDPAVNRLLSSDYMRGDWYTDMAVESGVYTFYAKLVHMGNNINIPEEVWRQLLYLSSLFILYYSIVCITRIFHQSPLVPITIVVLHAFLIINIPPPWLYGPFIQIDGGLAPRSIGVAFSFLALAFLLKNVKFLPWIILGVATLIHVSNSLIVFILFLGSFFIWRLLQQNALRGVVREALLGIGIYLVSGGWLVFSVAMKSNGLPEYFDLDKFIWIWIYFRASYMALPLVSFQDWVYFFAHVVSVISGWIFLLRYGKPEYREGINLLSIVSLGAVFFLFVFYIFTFVWPWLPGFQFYSLRVIYFIYFTAYLYFGLVLHILFRLLLQKSVSEMPLVYKGFILASTMVLSVVFLGVAYTIVPQVIRQAAKNYPASWERFLNGNPVLPKLGTEEHIVTHSEPFISPPDWYASPRHSTPYVPSATSFKSFGFTPAGAFQWFERMNDMSRGELQSEFERQKEDGKWRPASIQWNKYYSQFTTDEICILSRKYSTNLFLTYQELEYPFPLIASDTDFRLYRTEQCLSGINQDNL